MNLQEPDSIAFIIQWLVFISVALMMIGILQWTLRRSVSIDCCVLYCHGGLFHGVNPSRIKCPGKELHSIASLKTQDSVPCNLILTVRIPLHMVDMEVKISSAIGLHRHLLSGILSTTGPLDMYGEPRLRLLIGVRVARIREPLDSVSVVSLGPFGFMTIYIYLGRENPMMRNYTESTRQHPEGSSSSIYGLSGQCSDMIDYQIVSLYLALLRDGLRVRHAQFVEHCLALHGDGASIYVSS